MNQYNEKGLNPNQCDVGSRGSATSRRKAAIRSMKHLTTCQPPQPCGWPSHATTLKEISINTILLRTTRNVPSSWRAPAARPTTRNMSYSAVRRTAAFDQCGLRELAFVQIELPPVLLRRIIRSCQHDNPAIPCIAAPRCQRHSSL